MTLTYTQWLEQLCDEIPADELKLKEKMLNFIFDQLRSKGIDPEAPADDNGVGVIRGLLASYAYSTHQRWAEYHQERDDPLSRAMSELDLELQIIVGSHLFVGSMDQLAYRE